MLHAYRKENLELRSWFKADHDQPLTLETAWPLIVDMLRYPLFEEYGGSCSMKLLYDSLGGPKTQCLERVAIKLQTFFNTETNGIIKTGITPEREQFYISGLTRNQLIDRLEILAPVNAKQTKANASFDAARPQSEADARSVRIRKMGAVK